MFSLFIRDLKIKHSRVFINLTIHALIIDSELIIWVFRVINSVEIEIGLGLVYVECELETIS